MLGIVLSTVGTLVTLREEALVTEVPTVQKENQTKIVTLQQVLAKYVKCDEGNK